MAMPRRFNLLRDEDVSGISGTGLVAEGVVFHDGQYALSWFGKYHTIEVGPSIVDCLALHGHEGRTRIVWLDKEGTDE